MTSVEQNSSPTFIFHIYQATQPYIFPNLTKYFGDKI